LNGFKSVSLVTFYKCNWLIAFLDLYLNADMNGACPASADKAALQVRIEEA